jgi:hypothetical protein
VSAFVRIITLHREKTAINTPFLVKRRQVGTRGKGVQQLVVGHSANFNWPEAPANGQTLEGWVQSREIAAGSER